MYLFNNPDTGDKIKQQTNQKLSYSLEYILYNVALYIHTNQKKSPPSLSI